MRAFTKLLVIFCLLIFQIGCFQNRNESSNSNLIEENKKCNEISSETAVLIAKGKLLGEYEFDSYELMIQENSAAWIVIFSRKATGCCGGSPYVTVDKSDGKIIDVTHGK
jgi:outer membrane lipoprotein-sorting protein